MRSDPSELHKSILQPEHIKKMSRRDLARLAFVQGHRRRKTIDNSLRHTVNQHLDAMKEFEKGNAG